MKEKKYLLECNLDLVISVSEKNKASLLKKINGIISSALKNEDIVHINKQIHVTSEQDVLLSLAANSLKDIN